MENIKYIIESLLFVSESPITIDDIKKALVDAETPEIRDALNELTTEYETRKGGFYLGEVAGGYQLRTRPEFTEYIKRLLQPRTPRMSKAALETLAIIAYKQPVIRSEIEHIRGVDSGGILRMLLERKLIRILGKRKIPGRPLVYGTTKIFLETFDLKDLKDLPTPTEIETLEKEANDIDIIDVDEMADSYYNDPNQMQLFETGNTPETDADLPSEAEETIEASEIEETPDISDADETPDISNDDLIND